MSVLDMRQCERATSMPHSTRHRALHVMEPLDGAVPVHVEQLTFRLDEVESIQESVLYAVPQQCLESKAPLGRIKSLRWLQWHCMACSNSDMPCSIIRPLNQTARAGRRAS